MIFATRVKCINNYYAVDSDGNEIDQILAKKNSMYTAAVEVDSSRIQRYYVIDDYKQQHDIDLEDLEYYFEFDQPIQQ